MIPFEIIRNELVATSEKYPPTNRIERKLKSCSSWANYLKKNEKTKTNKHFN